MSFGIRRLLAMLALAGSGVLCLPPAHAQAAPDPGADPKLAEPLRDPDFGVRTSQPGLQRIVEMYQWLPADGGYAPGWSAEPVDSSAFAPGHDNPEFPLRGKQWLPETVTVDGVPLDADTIRTLGEWRDFRPGFSALPGNLTATFQPEGDGLGSAENPLAPEIGDLRIHWRERVLPPLADLIELRDGAWHMRPEAPALVAEAEPTASGGMLAFLPILIGGAGLLVLAIVLARRKR